MCDARILHLVTPAMRCAGKIYGASSAAAPRGIYVEIISVNILYLINMVHSSTVRAAVGREGGVDSCVDKGSAQKNCHAIVDFL